MVWIRARVIWLGRWKAFRDVKAKMGVARRKFGEDFRSSED